MLAKTLIFGIGKDAKALRTQSAKFILAGTATATLDYLILYLLTEHAGLGYFFSAAIGFVLGSVCNYVLSIRWVFIPGKFRQSIEFTLFMLMTVVGLMINQFIMWFMVDIILIHYLLAKAVAIPAVTVWNYISKKKLVFID